MKTLPNTDPDNALILGTALHTGIEEGVEAGLDYYAYSFPVLTDEHINELIKLEKLIPRVQAALPKGGIFEQRIEDEDFLGFSDYLVPVGIDADPDTGEEFSLFDLYDFKYSNAVDRYMKSRQLHEYKFFLEQTRPGIKIRYMYFVFVPKVAIRQKQTETIVQFRSRLLEALNEVDVQIKPVKYQPEAPMDFMRGVKHALECTDFPKEPSRLCGWCEYEEFCEKGRDYMLLPENKRRDITAPAKKVVWLYGAPFSGKTFFANQFPDPIMLNTDGNIKFVDAPFIPIRDEVKVEGRITKRQMAWQVFTDAVAELEKKQNDFKTVVVDLLEDTYEMCRVYICDQHGWKHESDDSFKAWDMVRTEFLNTLKKLVALDYENIVLISHEDRTRDLTRKTGDKISSIKPNLQDKVANKVAGMVDLVARIVADDNDRVLSFKASEVVFGGGRLTVRNREIPLDYTAFCEVYEEANSAAVKAVSGASSKEPTPTGETPVTGKQEGEKPTRRGRKATAEKPANQEPPLSHTQKVQDVEGSVQDGEEPQLPKCPDGDRIFKQHNDNPEIPLCPRIDAGHRCHKEDGPEGCPLLNKPGTDTPPWDGPSDQPPPPPEGEAPVRHTRKRRT